MGRLQSQQTSWSLILRTWILYERKQFVICPKTWQNFDMTSTPLHSTEKLETNQENSIDIFQLIPYTDLSKQQNC